MDDYDYVGRQDDNNCHICGRDMDNFTPRRYNIVEDRGRQKLVDVSKGVGTCPEHGVSYSEISMEPHERGNCSCEKNDCPVCA